MTLRTSRIGTRIRRAHVPFLSWNRSPPHIPLILRPASLGPRLASPLRVTLNVAPLLPGALPSADALPNLGAASKLKPASIASLLASGQALAESGAAAATNAAVLFEMLFCSVQPASAQSIVPGQGAAKAPSRKSDPRGDGEVEGGVGGNKASTGNEGSRGSKGSSSGAAHTPTPAPAGGQNSLALLVTMPAAACSLRPEIPLHGVSAADSSPTSVQAEREIPSVTGQFPHLSDRATPAPETHFALPPTSPVRLPVDVHPAHSHPADFQPDNFKGNDLNAPNVEPVVQPASQAASAHPMPGVDKATQAISPATVPPTTTPSVSARLIAVPMAATPTVATPWAGTTVQASPFAPSLMSQPGAAPSAPSTHAGIEVPLPVSSSAANTTVLGGAQFELILRPSGVLRDLPGSPAGVSPASHQVAATRSDPGQKSPVSPASLAVREQTAGLALPPNRVPDNGALETPPDAEPGQILSTVNAQSVQPKAPIPDQAAVPPMAPSETGAQAPSSAHPPSPTETVQPQPSAKPPEGVSPETGEQHSSHTGEDDAPRSNAATQSPARMPAADAIQAEHVPSFSPVGAPVERPIPPGTPAAPRPTASAAPAADPLPEPRSAQKTTDVQVVLETPGKDPVGVRVRDVGGEVQVTVRGFQRDLKPALENELPSLVRSLQREGWTVDPLSLSSAKLSAGRALSSAAGDEHSGLMRQSAREPVFTARLAAGDPGEGRQRRHHQESSPVFEREDAQASSGTAFAESLATEEQVALSNNPRRIS